MRIVPYLLASRVLLAPMAGVTDRPFREVCRRLGAGLAAEMPIDTLTGMAESHPGWRSDKERAHVLGQFKEARDIFVTRAAEAK